MSRALREAIARRRRIYLVRHGDVDYFAADGKPLSHEAVTLSALGRVQADALAELLEEVPIDRAVHTGLPRTRETLERVLAQRAVPSQEAPLLREITPGPFARLPEGEGREAAFTESLGAAISVESRFLGGELFGDFERRVLEGLAALLESSDWKHLLVAAHGGTNRVILCHALQAGLQGMGRLEQEPGCLNVIDVHDGGRLLVRQVNFAPTSPTKAGIWATTMETIYLSHVDRTRTASERTTP